MFLGPDLRAAFPEVKNFSYQPVVHAASQIVCEKTSAPRPNVRGCALKRRLAGLDADSKSPIGVDAFEGDWKHGIAAKR